MVFPPYLIKNLNYLGGLIQEQSINKILGSLGPCHMHEHNWSVKALLTASAPTSYPALLFILSQAVRRKRNTNLEIKTCPLTSRLPMLPLNVPFLQLNICFWSCYFPSASRSSPHKCATGRNRSSKLVSTSWYFPYFLLISNREEDWGTRAATATSLEDKGLGVPITF